MSIKLEQYKIFNEAASSLSFSTAARNLFISQSAVSQTISTLEKELNTQLFIRQSKGVVLTNEGTLLYQQISQALSIITDVENSIANQNILIGGELRIGTGDTLCKHFVLPIITKFHEKYPDVLIKVINRPSSETISLLKTGQVDLAIVNMPIHEEGVLIEPCFIVHDVFVGSKPDEKFYNFKEIAKLPLIMLETSSVSRRYIDDLFASSGILINPNIELGAHDLLIDFAANDLGVACVIKEFCEKELLDKKIYIKKTSQVIQARTVGYAYLERRTLTPAAAKFIAMSKELTQIQEID